MAEGIVPAAGHEPVLYESDSKAYAGASSCVKTVHRAPVSSVVGP